MKQTFSDFTIVVYDASQMSGETILISKNPLPLLAHVLHHI